MIVDTLFFGASYYLSNQSGYPSSSSSSLVYVEPLLIVLYASTSEYTSDSNTSNKDCKLLTIFFNLPLSIFISVVSIVYHKKRGVSTPLKFIVECLYICVCIRFGLFRTRLDIRSNHLVFDHLKTIGDSIHLVGYEILNYAFILHKLFITKADNSSLLPLNSTTIYFLME